MTIGLLEASVSPATPNNAASVQKVVEDRLDALEKDGLQETVSVEWRGQQKALPVISMPIDLLSYNPDTHRIRAQRSLDAERNLDLDADPFGASAQNYLHKLLMGSPSDPSKIDPSFELLKDDLKEHGQSDPGIITRSGVLVNGNTRRAALKALGQEHIRVGVLPTDAGHSDLQSIELSLQLRKDHKRDYSFMNLLLAVDERVQAGRPAGEIQRDFRIAVRTFDRYRWILEFVRSAIARSATIGAAGQEVSMRLVNFESDKGQLEELHRAYMATQLKSPDDAEALVEQRLLAMILDKSKTDLRFIEPDFVKKFMKGGIPQISTSTEVIKIPGTSIEAAPVPATVQALRALTTSVLQAKAVALHPELVTPEAMQEATTSLLEYGDKVHDALEKAGKNSRIKKKRFAASERISDGTEHIDLAVAAVADARSTGNFKIDDVDEAINDLRQSVRKLAQIVALGTDPASLPPSITWLRAAASLPEFS